MLHFSAKNNTRLALIALTILPAQQAFAHDSAVHAAMSFAAGFTHPFSGLDHLLAMLAVGLWAAQQKRSAQWALPLAFPLMMAVGAAAGMALVMPGVEIGIAASVAALGVLIFTGFNMPAWSSAALVSLFALAHGYAHGVELPQGVSMVLYGMGFVAATIALHLTGLALGLLAGEKIAARTVRVTGAGIAAAGVYLLAGLT